MAAHRNIWTPDTCARPGCRIEFSFDDALPADEVRASYQLVSLQRTCAAHQGLTPQEIYDAAFTENGAKNEGLRALADLDPTLDVSAVPWRMEADQSVTIDAPAHLDKAALRRTLKAHRVTIR